MNINAIALLDCDGGRVLLVDFHEKGEWITQEIPEDSEIIGLHMSKGGRFVNAITNLGFILWKPNPLAIH